ncbi:pilus assembly FimT family protein [Geomesophilobacter sediminis]|uniref:Prepilin-type N-terminal cleavage/methylation domain-containing protein n=1 Tax=Geomesophilobacter sediminis TaxID=2798584 RepID=A0A8J7M2H7_9BACT|nr:prepilin-type N-terminal cleavage/methylation domain-containing protein [Geomesophilobacter sediminis]MBJ6727437.1 prepilin-type N-terminal cleavage/methylation domain-containing protein [Geomesophilobacter sediminis]
MQRNGFTLVELVMVVAVAAILFSLATMQFRRMNTKALIEQQVRIMTGDLTQARTQALFKKKDVAVKITANALAVYSSAVVTPTPVLNRTLRYSVSTGGTTDPLIFTTRGIIDGITNASICIEPSTNEGAIDSILLSTTRIHTGKRNAGTSCDSANIVIQ